MDGKFIIKKKLGQNFLKNKGVIEKIVEVAKIKDSVVIEIGPGFGHLTKELLKKAKKVIAIEKDAELFYRLKDGLKDEPRLELINEDFLKLDLQNIVDSNINNGCVKICANLPYYITSQAIVKTLKTYGVESATFMVQKEAAKRLCCPPGQRGCGAISFFVSYYSKPIFMFNVSRRSFFPVPNVDSSVIKLIFKNKKDYGLKSEEVFFRLIKAAFKERRKKIINPVSKEFEIKKEKLAEIFETVGLRGDERAENLNIYEYVKLANHFYEMLLL